MLGAARCTPMYLYLDVPTCWPRLVMSATVTPVRWSHAVCTGSATTVQRMCRGWPIGCHCKKLHGQQMPRQSHVRERHQLCRSLKGVKYKRASLMMSPQLHRSISRCAYLTQSLRALMPPNYDPCGSIPNCCDHVKHLATSSVEPAWQRQGLGAYTNHCVYHSC